MVRIVEVRGSAGELHGREMASGNDVEVWLMRPTGIALVRGSAQKPAQFDVDRLAAAGVELAGRRTGGGAVWIDPAAVVWIDVLAPRTSSLWSDDLAQTFVRTGEAWKRAFAAVGVELDLVTSSPSRDQLARWVCWAGQGWGELVRPEAGGGIAKVVGLSQRRTRWGARIQAMAVLDGSARFAAEWFRDADAPAVDVLQDRIGRSGLDSVVDRAALEDAVLSELTALA